VRAPTEDRLIASGPASSGTSREPGSITEERIFAAQKVSLGQVERKCAGCGRDWDGDLPVGESASLGRRAGVCTRCGSAEFSERDVRPTLMEITGAGITKVEEKPKAKVFATPDELSTLRSLRPALIDVENNLLNADARLHCLVTESEENAQVFGFLQGAVHYLTDATTGDFSVGSSHQSLLGPARALSAAVDRGLTRYEKEKALPKVSATPEDVAALNSLRTALLDLQDPLVAADQCLHRLVNVNEANFDVFGGLQGAVHFMTDGTIGDFDLTDQVVGLSLLGPARALRAEIERVLYRYEEEKAKK
jgi:hypothetical protein